MLHDVPDSVHAFELLLCLLPVVEAPHCEGDFSLLAETLEVAVRQ